MENEFIKRAIELAKEIEKTAKLDDSHQLASRLEGYLTGALEVFALLEKGDKVE